MPKFSKYEKEQIRERLLTKGKELFSKFGLIKTSVDDIVHACGIAKGSFYTFFSSKEELFYVILKNEESIRDRMLGELMRENVPPKELISSFFHIAYRLTDENPILQTVFQEGEYEKIVRKVPKQLLDESSKDDMDKGISFINILIENGTIKETDAEAVAGIIKAMLLFRLQKDQFKDELFGKVMERLIDYVAEGLTTDQQS